MILYVKNCVRPSVCQSVYAHEHSQRENPYPYLAYHNNIFHQTYVEFEDIQSRATPAFSKIFKNIKENSFHIKSKGIPDSVQTLHAYINNQSLDRWESCENRTISVERSKL